FAHLVYVSSWLKWRYPAAFAAALLNSQPMGFYAPAQIVRDAREHGVEVREIDVNCSDWDCTMEPLPLDGGGSGGGDSRDPLHVDNHPTPAPPHRGEGGVALRLGLRQIDGLQ